MVVLLCSASDMMSVCHILTPSASGYFTELYNSTLLWCLDLEFNFLPAYRRWMLPISERYTKFLSVAV